MMQDKKNLKRKENKEESRKKKPNTYERDEVIIRNL